MAPSERGGAPGQKRDQERERERERDQKREITREIRERERERERDQNREEREPTNTSEKENTDEEPAGEHRARIESSEARSLGGGMPGRRLAKPWKRAVSVSSNREPWISLRWARQSFRS